MSVSTRVLDKEQILYDSNNKQPKSTKLLILKRQIDHKKISTIGIPLEVEKGCFNLVLDTYDDLTRRLNVEKQIQNGPLEQLETLLQVSSSHNVFVFDISQSIPTEVSCVEETEFFFDPQLFPSLSFQRLYCKSQKHIECQVRLWDEITTNRDRSMYVLTQRDQRSLKNKEMEKRQEPESKGIFRSYSMIDLYELKHLHNQIDSAEELDMKVIELVKTVFGRHTVFSVLQYNEDRLTKIMDVIAQEQEQILKLAGQASEAERNSDFARILYRVFNMPTPEFHARAKSLREAKLATEKQEFESVIRRSK